MTTPRKNPFMVAVAGLFFGLIGVAYILVSLFCFGLVVAISVCVFLVLTPALPYVAGILIGLACLWIVVALIVAACQRIKKLFS